MKEKDAQINECGVSFEPVLDDPEQTYIAVEYDRPFQLLTLDEALALDKNLHAAFRRAYLARRRPGQLGMRVPA